MAAVRWHKHFYLGSCSRPNRLCARAFAACFCFFLLLWIQNSLPSAQGLVASGRQSSVVQTRLDQPGTQSHSQNWLMCHAGEYCSSSSSLSLVCLITPGSEAKRAMEIQLVGGVSGRCVDPPYPATDGACQCSSLHPPDHKNSTRFRRCLGGSAADERWCKSLVRALLNGCAECRGWRI